MTRRQPSVNARVRRTSQIITRRDREGGWTLVESSWVCEQRDHRQEENREYKRSPGWVAHFVEVSCQCIKVAGSDPWSGKEQESIDKCIKKWKNKSVFLLPFALSLKKKKKSTRGESKVGNWWEAQIQTRPWEEEKLNGLAILNVTLV